MRKAKRILLVASVTVLVVGSAEAGLFGRKAKAAEPVRAASAMSLTAIESDASRVVLRTSGTPAYTSYSPSPDVFIVDLTATSRPAELAVPAPLPGAVTSVAAEEVTEMGSRLTRVTFRLSQPLSLQAAAAENSVVINFPAVAVEAAAPESVPAIAPVTVAETTRVEPVAEQPAAAVSEPSVIAEPISAPKITEVVPEADLPKATKLQTVDTSRSGESLEVRIAGDGAMTYKAFRLENPARLVIDVDGVNNRVAKNTIAVNDSVVQRVRVAQFKTGAQPVARVVVDLAAKSEYTISKDGKYLRVAFGGGQLAPMKREATPAVAAMTVTPVPAPKVQPAVNRQPAPADIPSQVPAIAEEWKMPPPSAPAKASKGARSVITSAGDQASPSRPMTTPATPAEDVFNDAAQQTTSQSSAQILSGSRTLNPNQRTYTGEPLSLNLKDADVRDVLRTFAELTGLNVAVDPDVRGQVTVDFVDVPWDQALDIILRQNGLTYAIEGNVMRIGRVERLAAEATATRRLAEEERLNVPLTTVIFKLSYARAPEVQTLLREIASPRARIIVDVRTNQLIISEIAQYLQTMRNLIETVDVPTRQVAIEARIVETSHIFTQQYGFSWGFSGALDPSLGTGTGLVFPNRVGFIGGPFAFTGGLADSLISFHLTDVLGNFGLDFALHAAELDGLARVVSAPRVVTQDNVSAEIQSGLQIPYQTRVNFTTTVTYIDATLRLSVTPQITEAGTVIMDIQLQKIEPLTAFAIEGAAGTSLSTRTARTRLMVRDGATSVIGGIYTTRENDNRNRVPFVHQLPIIGALFRGHNISTQQDELLIFITPRIVRG